MLKKELVWFGPPFSYSGYALHNRAMIFELLKLGWDIRLIPTEDHIPPDLIGKKVLQNLVKNTHIDAHNSLCINLVPPPALPHLGLYTILFTTLESKTVHEGFYRRCTMFDEVWVPCKFNVKSMRKAGIKRKNLYYCPEGVYSNFWTNQVEPSPDYKSNQFTFFYNGDWSYRKGMDILIRAYARAFSPTDNVRLLLLTHFQGNGPEVSRQCIGDEMRHICATYNITRLPPIQFIYDHVPDPAMPSIYRCADAYVCPTRGEAWGLPIIQAMSCGIASIIPEWGGQRDYCNSDTSLLIDVEKFDTIHDKVGLDVDFYRYQDFCFSSVDSLVNLMRYSYCHPDEIKLKGKVAAEHVRRYFQWENSGRIADRRLNEVLQTRYRKRLSEKRRVYSGRY